MTVSDAELINRWEQLTADMTPEAQHGDSAGRPWACQLPERRIDFLAGPGVAIDLRCHGCLIGTQMFLLNGSKNLRLGGIGYRDEALRMLELVRPTAGVCEKPPRIVQPVGATP